MVPGTPIVTVSLDEQRIFRLTHPKKKLRRDFLAEAGTVFVMPYNTNLVWKHSVPKRAHYRGRQDLDHTASVRVMTVLYLTRQKTSFCQCPTVCGMLDR